MAITLGKDCQVVMDGGVISSARNVTISESARTIEVNQFGSRFNAVYVTGYDTTITVEFNDPADLGAAYLRLHTGSSFLVRAGAGGSCFRALVTGITESDPIDGVVTCVIEAKMAHPTISNVRSL